MSYTLYDVFKDVKCASYTPFKDIYASPDGTSSNKLLDIYKISTVLVLGIRI